MIFPMEKRDIEHLSHLARIELTGDEERELEGDVGEVLEYVKNVQNISAFIDATTDTSVGDVVNVTREDKINDRFSTERITELVPGSQDGYLLVKKVLKQ